jgi:hypothetical protein
MSDTPKRICGAAFFADSFQMIVPAIEPDFAHLLSSVVQ